jgi:hypothetical protein
MFHHGAGARPIDHMPRRPILAGIHLAAVTLLAHGCASTRVTDPPRTATEQFLLSRAAANAVDKLSFESLRGRRVFVDNSYFAASEQAFVLGELRARLLSSGVLLAPDAEHAQVVLEVRSSGVGIDRDDHLLGIPSIQAGTAVSGALGGVPILTPEIAITKSRYQLGVAGVSYVAYWADTGEIVASSGPFVGRSVRDDWWFFGVGPRSTGNIPTIPTPSAE